MQEKIDKNKVYTTEEARDFLRVSESTIKRMLKSGIIVANKVGGRYRIWGKELLKLVSPEATTKASNLYQKLRRKTKKIIEKW